MMRTQVPMHLRDGTPRALITCHVIQGYLQPVKLIHNFSTYPRVRVLDRSLGTCYEVIWYTHCHKLQNANCAYCYM